MLGPSLLTPGARAADAVAGRRDEEGVSLPVLTGGDSRREVVDGRFVAAKPV